MRRIFLFLSITSLLVFLTSCQEELSPIPEQGEQVITINVRASVPTTKTVISDNGSVSSFQFVEGDCIGFFAGNVLLNRHLQCTDGESGFFGAQIKIENESQSQYRASIPYYAYYPYGSSAGTNPASLSGKLPSTQSAPFDGKADFILANVLVDEYRVDPFPVLNLTFDNHLFAIVKLSVTNTSEELADEEVLEIGLKSTGPALAGSFTFNATKPTQAAVFSSTPSALSNRVHVKYDKNKRPKLGSGITHSVYAVVNAADFDAGTLQLVVETTNYRYYVTSNSDVSLARNQVTVLPTVDLSNDGKVYKVSDHFTSFSLSDGENVYPAFEIGESTVSIQVPNKKDVSDMTVSFTHSGTSVTVAGVEQTSGDYSYDFSDFSNPMTYVVTGADGESRNYTIRVFDLPIVFVDTPAPITSKDTWTDDCAISILEYGSSVVDYGNKAQVRGRGNTTWNKPKNPYTIKLASKAAVLGMPADKRWNLLANYYDRTLIRNEVSLEVARRTEGMDWASRGVFVELIMNGEFQGTYYLCEHIKVASKRVNITEIGKNDLSGEAITGGYLLEYDMRPDDDPYFYTSTCVYRVNVKSPDDAGFDTQRAWIANYVNNVEKVLSNPDSLASHKYLNYMDIDSYIDWWLTYEISGCIEPNNPLSCYMYKDRGGKMKAGPVWDFDIYTYLPGTTGFKIKNALYYKYLFQDPLFVARIKEKWPTLKSNLEGMPDYIDLTAASVARAAARNAKMWPIYGGYNSDESLSVPDANARLKSAFIARIVELDGLINNLSVTYDNKGAGTEDFGNQQNPDFGFEF